MLVTKEVTTHEAKTHLSKLLEEVERGGQVVILRNRQPIAKLVRVSGAPRGRPKVGEVTSAPVRVSADAFAPLSDEELETWGL